jgi:tagatose 1,6-diphosphate aldolase
MLGGGDMDISVGKRRGLQATSTEQALFAILALDHRDSLRRAMRSEEQGNVSYDEVVVLKLEIIAALADHASGVLLDPVYGAAQAVMADGLPGRVGLLVAVEESGYTGDTFARRSRILPGWSVAQIKRLGASAVKLLVTYHPDGGEVTRAQEELVRQVADECQQQDISLFLEPVSYSLDPGAPKGSVAFAQDRVRVVVETARRLGGLGAHVLKLEFPVDVDHEADESAWRTACRLVSEASTVSWALLSAGVDFGTFRRQVEIACQEGASGYLAGRAIWKEAVALEGEARVRFLREEAARRLDALMAIADREGRPWTEFYPPQPVPEGWYRTYGGA